MHQKDAATQQILDIIRHQAYHQARAEMEPFNLVRRDGDTLHLGKSSTITLNPDGTIEAQGPIQRHRIHMRPRERGCFFRSEWAQVHSEAVAAITKHLERSLQTKHREAAWQHEGSRDPFAMLLYTTPVQKAIAKAALGLRSTVGKGYLHNPAKLGYGVLHDFLGKDRVSQTLRIAGAHATIRDFNIVAHNPQAFEQAHRLNPNATTLSFYQRAYTPELAAHLTPEHILNWAKDHYHQETRLFPGTPEESWPAFTNLNHRAINTHPDKDIAAYAAIAKAAKRYGANPSYTGVLLLLTLDKLLNQLPSPLVSSYIIESHNLAEKRRTGQRQLAHQMAQAVDILEHHFEPPLRTAIQQMPDGVPWAEIAALIPGDPEHTPSRSYTRKRPKRAPQSRPRTDKPTPPTSSQLRAIVNGPAHSDLAIILAAPLTFTADAGSVTITPANGVHPLFKATKLPNGTIQILDPSGFHNELMLPDPAKRGKLDPAWSTRGRARQTASEMAQAYLRYNWDRFAPTPLTPLPSPSKVSAAVAHITDGLDDLLSLQLADALRSLIDPDVYEQARLLAPHTTVHRYNIIAALKPHLPHLLDTTPGALRWALTNVTIDEPLNHPGQVITATRNSLTEAGLKPGHWHSAATLPLDLMAQICSKSHTPKIATLLLNSIAMASVTPAPDLLEFAIQRTAYLLHEDKPGVSRDNTQTMLKLLFRDAPWDQISQTAGPGVQAQTYNDAMDVSDYVRHLNA